MQQQEHLVVNFNSPCERYVLTIEDNKKVAYAYLKQDGKIIGDVWLYNHIQTPQSPEWKDRSKIPFANCKGYMSEEGRLNKKVVCEDYNLDWEYEDGKPTAYVYVFEELYGVVGVGDKPGYSRFAIKDSRLGRVMEIEENEATPRRVARPNPE